MTQYTSTSTESIRGASRVAKLLAFALDPAAQIAEAQNAANRMVQTARAENVTFPALLRSMAIVPAISVKPEPDACSVEINFGRHSGQTLGDIARRDLSYLKWLAQNIEDEDLNAAVQEVLAHFARKGKK